MDRKKFLKLLEEMPDEGFLWLLLACQASAMTSNHGHKSAKTQIWPDGLGGFQGRDIIEEVRKEAAKLIKEMESK